MRYIRTAAVLALLGLVWVLGPATPAASTGDGPTPIVTHVVSTPDNGCPPWARDTMTRTTTIEVTEYGVGVSFHDVGVFDLPDGRQGTVVGDVRFHKLEGTVKDDLPGEETLDNSEFDCKDDVPTDRRVGNWPLRYVDSQQTSELKSWEWTYTLCGVPYTENAESAEVSAEQFPEADADECQPPEEETTTTTVQEPDLPANCDEAALLPDQYWPHLDGDQDGTSCEEEQPQVAPPAVPVPAQPQFTG